MKILIVQFHPIELYPPVQNLLNAIQNELPPNSTVKVHTTRSQSNDTFELNDSRIKIERLCSYTLDERTFKRYFLYLKFYVLSFLKIIKYKPNKILYFEAISSLSPLLFKKLYPKVQLYIHYHEYISPEEYKSGILNKILHGLEMKFYKSAEWISHTNKKRMNFFLNDINMRWGPTMHVLPNHPPKSWSTKQIIKAPVFPFKLVYVGSFSSFETLYIKEFIDWLIRLDGKLCLDIYCYSTTKEIKEYIESLPKKVVKLQGLVKYELLPEVLKNYDVGIILYKGYSKNVIYSEPNKLFEYLSCGLDVWFPNEIAGCRPFITQGIYPKVISVDFNNLNSFDLDEALSKKNLKKVQSNFYSEKALDELFKPLLSLY